MSRTEAVAAVAWALSNQATAEIWRSYEALAEAAVDAAAPHLLTGPARTYEDDPLDLFDDDPCMHDSMSGVDLAEDGPDKVWRCDGCGATGTTRQLIGVTLL